MRKSAHQLESWQREDAARLLSLFEKYRANGGLKQEDFAAEHEIGSQGNMGHYLHGRRPLRPPTHARRRAGFFTPRNWWRGNISARIAAKLLTNQSSIAIIPPTR